MIRKPKPGTISISVSISVKHGGYGAHTAHYAFPDFEFAECAFDELRAAARRYTELAAKGRHACSERRRRKVNHGK
jgi:hypothetical protein